ncbi:hypothetical protein B484DRAFT_438855 [Ochromonadaceae sp. CCMP2298]|nr:hypothetical protein B484DRAFT_438855 [Ochromonadaceae sp. CCMP2298]
MYFMIIIRPTHPVRRCGAPVEAREASEGPLKSLSWWLRGHRFGALLWRILDLKSPAEITLASAPPPLRPSKKAIERCLVGNPERFYRHQLHLSRMPSICLGASKLISMKERKRVKRSQVCGEKGGDRRIIAKKVKNNSKKSPTAFEWWVECWSASQRSNHSSPIPVRGERRPKLF